MRVTIPYERPAKVVTVVSEAGGEAIELVFDARVTEVDLRPGAAGWQLAFRGVEGQAVGDAGAPLEGGQWSGFPGLEWDPSIGARLFVQAPDVGAVLRVVAR